MIGCKQHHLAVWRPWLQYEYSCLGVCCAGCMNTEMEISAQRCLAQAFINSHRARRDLELSECELSNSFIRLCQVQKQWTRSATDVNKRIQYKTEEKKKHHAFTVQNILTTHEGCNSNTVFNTLLTHGKNTLKPHRNT